jgi:hypothetical protein
LDRPEGGHGLGWLGTILQRLTERDAACEDHRDDQYANDPAKSPGAAAAPTASRRTNGQGE